MIAPHSSFTLYKSYICAIIVLSKVQCAKCYIFSKFCERTVYFSNVFDELPFSTFFYVWCSLLLFTRPSSVNLFVFWIFVWLLVFTISTFFPLSKEEEECIGHVVKSPLPRKAFFNKMSEWSRLTFFFNILFYYRFSFCFLVSSRYFDPTRPSGTGVCNSLNEPSAYLYMKYKYMYQ